MKKISIDMSLCLICLGMAVLFGYLAYASYTSSWSQIVKIIATIFTAFGSIVYFSLACVFIPRREK